MIAKSAIAGSKVKDKMDDSKALLAVTSNYHDTKPYGTF